MDDESRLQDYQFKNRAGNEEGDFEESTTVIESTATKNQPSTEEDPITEEAQMFS